MYINKNCGIFLGQPNRHAFPIIRNGQKKELKIEDVNYNLAENEAGRLGDELALALATSQIQNSSNPLFKALWKIYGWRHYITLTVHIRPILSICYFQVNSHASKYIKFIC